MSNTIIQIKRSQTTPLPTSLQYGELAYSFQSGKLFLGDQSNNAIAIAGNSYNQIIDSATSANVATKLVKRDSFGNFSAATISAELDGNASTATKWKTPRYIGIDGDATGQVLVDGSTNANVHMTLNTINSNIGTFGGLTQIPIFSVNDKGLITSASNTTISTTLNVEADSNTTGINLLSDTMTFVGGSGITTNIVNNDVIFDVDNTVVRTSGNQTINGTLFVGGNLDVTGNTIFRGNTSLINVENYLVSDPMIYLAANNYYSDIVSIGFAGNYFDGTKEMHTGLFRKPSSNSYYLFVNVWDELSNTNNVSPSANGFMLADLNANLVGGIVANLSSAIAVSDGGTGRSSFASGQMLVGNGTGQIQSVANVVSINVNLGSNQTISNITTDNWGRVVDFSYQNISGLTLSQGGTNNTTYVTGELIISNGTSLVSLSNTNVIGTFGSASHVPMISTDGYGRIISATNTSISISADQVTSGILPYTRGGTGSASTPTAGGIAYGNGTSLLLTSAGTPGQTIISNGVTAPSFGTLDLSGGGLGFTSASANSVIYYSGSGNIMSYTNTPIEGQILQYSVSSGVSFNDIDGGSF